MDIIIAFVTSLFTELTSHCKHHKIITIISISLSVAVITGLIIYKLYT